MKYKTIESKIPFSQAYPFIGHYCLAKYVIQYDEDGSYIPEKYTSFKYLFDN